MLVMMCDCSFTGQISCIYLNTLDTSKKVMKI